MQLFECPKYVIVDFGGLTLWIQLNSRMALFR